MCANSWTITNCSCSSDKPVRAVTGNNTIGRLTTAGVVKNYKSPTIGTPFGIVTGPDGALWFTNEDNDTIGRIAVVGGTVTSYAGDGIREPRGIALGADGIMTDDPAAIVPALRGI